jgi:hypothetical protein
MAQAYREQMTVTGDFARVNIYPVRQYQYGRKKKMKPTGAAMERVNRINRARRFADLINLNFTKADYQLKLDYSAFKCSTGRNPNPDEVVRCVRNFMRRLKRLYDKLGIELKYIYVSEVGTRGHISHHHVIINAGASFEDIKALWHEGGIWMRKLYFDKRGCSDLAEYFCKSKYTYRSYTCSKNLRRPQESGPDKSVYKNDYKVRQKQVNYILNGEVEQIRRMYPEWELAELPDISHTLDKDTGEVRLPTWGVFITIYLYKPSGLSDAASNYEKYEKSFA